jgi:hypothetical protein
MSEQTASTAVTCGECKFMFFGADAVQQFIGHPCSTTAWSYDAAKPEPPPVNNDREAIQDLVVEDIEARKAMGIAKYGTPLQAFNGRDALNDAYQEALDLVMYLRQALYERAHVVVDDQCSCGCNAAVGCGKDGCPHEQP